MTQQFYQLVPLPNLFSISNTLISLLNPRCEHSIPSYSNSLHLYTLDTCDI